MGMKLDPKADCRFSQAYFSNLDVMVRYYEPVLKGIGRWNLELIGLVARRSLAWLAIPTRLRQCKSPVDFLNEQWRFWQTFASDYSESSHRLGMTLGARAVVPQMGSIAPRDYITVQEPDGTSSASTRGDRKAA